MIFLKKACFTVLWLFFTVQPLYSQTISIPDTLKGWNVIWTANLNGSQASYTNWSQGGASSISGTGSTVFTLLNRKGRRGYGFRVNLKYGQSYVNKEGVRKTDDVLSLRNRLENDLREEGKLSVYASSRFETQFRKGYKYESGVAGRDSLISDFMSPAYFFESFGIAFNPDEYFTMEVGLGLKQTYIADGALSENYGLEPNEHFRAEGGLSAGIGYQKEIFKDIFYSASFETFTNLLNGLKETDIFWSNELDGEINNRVHAVFQLEVRYDEDFSSELQVKQVLSVGISLNLFD